MPTATREVLNPSGVETLDDLIDEKQLSGKLDLAVATLRNWRSKGEGPDFVKLGKRAVRYTRSSIDAFIAKGSKAEGGEQ